MHEAQGEVIRSLGYRHHLFLADEPIPADADIVFVQGPYGPILPLVQQLVARPPAERPVLVYWFQQSLNLTTLPPLRRLLETTFSDLYRHYGGAGWLGRLADRVAPGFAVARGTRLSFVGDILWLHRHNLLDVLALSSTVYADYLARYGISSLLVPRGYHPGYGTVLGLPRDITVVWMGKLRTRRRREKVYWLREELVRRGHTMLLFDGHENDFIFGEARTHILNRTWFVANIFFSGPTDELSIRYYIAAANGAVVITEPGQNRYPFIPGKHLVECPVEQMPDTIEYYLAHPAEWQAIAGNMLHLLQTEITLEKSIARLLARAEAILHRRRNRNEQNTGTP
ncbi:MAG: glycosyltransferase family 1 protein [Caldilineae bacterium]|nr:MAG: glycosyltransferase family 1 protein [Caldilineae bacterium]